MRMKTSKSDEIRPIEFVSPLMTQINWINHLSIRLGGMEGLEE